MRFSIIAIQFQYFIEKILPPSDRKTKELVKKLKLIFAERILLLHL